MRLVFVLTSLVLLILVSRWLTLSENSPFAKGESQVVELADDQQFEEPRVDSKVAIAVYDDPTDIRTVQRPPLLPDQLNLSIPQPLSSMHAPIADPWFEAAPQESASRDKMKPRIRSQVGSATNIQRLVRAEYKVSAQNAESLALMEFDAVYETSVIDNGSGDMVVLQVTCDERIQRAISNLLNLAGSPSRSVRKRNESTIRTLKKSPHPKTCQKYCESCMYLE